jgi:hypothetical protein
MHRGKKEDRPPSLKELDPQTISIYGRNEYIVLDIIKEWMLLPTQCNTHSSNKSDTHVVLYLIYILINSTAS